MFKYTCNLLLLGHAEVICAELGRGLIAEVRSSELKDCCDGDG